MQGNPHDPYRFAQPRPQTELERLAAEGQRRHEVLAGAASRDASDEASRNLRVALGAHYGTPFLRGAAVVQYASIVALVGAIALSGVVIPEVVGAVALLGGVVAFVLVFVRAFWTPTATQSMCDAEARWIASFPFPIAGYFEALAAKPEVYCTFDVVVELAPGVRAPEQATLVGVIQLRDPTVAGCSIHGAQLRWMSGRIFGSTGIAVNRVPVYRNHRVVKYVHDIVDGVLMPLHHDYPIARVTMHRI